MGDPAPELDERLHADAILALLNASTALNGNAYEFDSIPGSNGDPGTLPDTYVGFSVARRYVPAGRLSGQIGRTSWRISTRYVGRTTGDARLAAFKVATALDQQFITVGTHTALIRLDEGANDAISLDDGRYSGLSQWLYTL